MNTPIYDFLRSYAASGTLRCHMPGHKGRSVLPELQQIFALDITEISGADSLFEAGGIVRESEKNMSRLYGSADTFYSAGGSTLCIQAMLAVMKLEGRRVVAVRNVHRAFLNAAALLGLDVEWLMPEYSGGLLSGKVSLDEAERLLSYGKRSCLYVTSPDYTGQLADIRALAELCRRLDVPLLVDNAHGAHLRFLPEDSHPITLGATMCCDSAHKMLPALTGAAMLHTSSERYAGVLRQCMSLFGSTSPSYLIMASLDLCCDYIDRDIRRDIAENLEHIESLRSRFTGKLLFSGGDPFHITIRAAECGIDGISLAEELRKNGAECEYADRWLVILLMSPMSRSEDYAALEKALEQALKTARRCEKTAAKPDFLLPERVMSVREAALSDCEEIPADLSEGRICASVKVPCPPAIPIAASGERIDRRCVALFRDYGIETVMVVKED